MHGTHRRAGGKPDCPCQDCGCTLRRDLEAALHQRREQAGVVDHLMGEAPARRAIDRARDDDQRRALLRRIRNAVDRVRKAGPKRGDEKARRPGHEALARRHQCRLRLVPGEVEVDPGTAEGVDEGHDLAPRHPEGRAHPMRGERLGDAIGHPPGLARK